MLRSEDLLSRVPGVFRCVSSPSHRVRQPPWSAAVRLVCSEMSERPLCLPHCAHPVLRPRATTPSYSSQRHERRTPRARPFFTRPGSELQYTFNKAVVLDY